MDKLVVRLYNVRFGDGVLISVPDQDESGAPMTRHILIDVGNVTSGEGGENEVFRPVIEDVLATLDGRPLDLYVMTHEHLDHVQGLLWAAEKVFTDGDLAAELVVRHTWMPASSRPAYYDDHPEAEKKLAEAADTYFAIERHLATSGVASGALDVLMRNNNRFKKASGLSHGRTADCVEYIRGLAGGQRTHYVHRSVGKAPLYDLARTHPFRDPGTKLEIWAPEEDSANDYGRFKPMALGAAFGDFGSLDAPQEPATPPPGVDAGAFYNLIALREGSYVDNLLAIDQAANNSSIVFCLEWRGWRLLFPGDAEIRSWKEMNKEEVLSPVHFLKISHHGSRSGTPDGKLLNKILPVPSPDGRPRHAAVSTYPETYSGIPHDETLEELRHAHGCSVHSTLGLADGASITIELKG